MNKKTHGKQSNYLMYDPRIGGISINPTDTTQSIKDKKAGIIYARVSTEEQKIKGNGISAQITDCKHWAKQNDITIVREPFIDEAISGTNLKRKNFLEAIRFLEKENKNGVKIDYFICSSTSRFSRSAKINETFDTVARVETTGAKLVAIGNGGIQDTNSEEGLLTTGFNFLMDAIESKRGQKRVRYGLKGKIYEGLRPFPATPLGYDRTIQKIGGKEVKFLVKKEPEASVLKEGLELFADGVLLTKQQLFEFLDERGIKSHSAKNKSGKLHPQIIDRILDLRKLQVYTGYLSYPDR
jgi:DNA invertase Pin-like site-specific DNA recombinase